MADEYRRFWIASSRAEERERLLAEAFEAGAEGAEEEERNATFRACVYVAGDRAEAVRARLQRVASALTRVGRLEPVPSIDWSEAWKEGLAALRISSRLVVRPPFVEWALEPGQREVVIDPGQAFGTGAHASTRLCLDWIDALYRRPEAARDFDRVLDVGTGSGVLALAAAALGAASAFGFDLDAQAIEAARQAARANGLADRVEFETGPLASVVPASRRYPLVVANLLKREILPIVTEVARCVSPAGRLVLSGLLEQDGPEILSAFGREGLLEVQPRREIRDDAGCWIGLCLGRGPHREGPA
jgi:ribosomal protein L11 methyltransferase